MEGGEEEQSQIYLFGITRLLHVLTYRRAWVTRGFTPVSTCYSRIITVISTAAKLIFQAQF